MLVKKKNPNWIPSENRGLRVGDTIEITDPRQLILNGDVVGLGEKGEELSPYDLYGVITKDERMEFEEFLKYKKAEEQRQKLQAEAKALETQLEEAKKAEEAKKVEEVKKIEEPKKVEEMKKK